METSVWPQVSQEAHPIVRTCVQRRFLAVQVHRDRRSRSTYRHGTACHKKYMDQKVRTLLHRKRYTARCRHEDCMLQEIHAPNARTLLRRKRYMDQKVRTLLRQTGRSVMRMRTAARGTWTKKSEPSCGNSSRAAHSRTNRTTS